MQNSSLPIPLEKRIPGEQIVDEEEERIKFLEEQRRKIAEKSSENFTIIRIPSVESFHIHKMSPEKMMECKIIQNHTSKIYPNYIKKFKRIK